MNKLFEKIKKLINVILIKNNKRLKSDEKQELIYEDNLYAEYGECEKLKKGNLKILFIADTHDSLKYDDEIKEYIKNAKNYDACILLGDLSSDDLYEILQIVPKEKIYGVLGNHDGWDRFDKYNINNIHGKIIEINGYKIAGFGGSFKYKDSNEYVMYSHEDSIKIADTIEKSDILISHDKTFTKNEFGKSHDGLKGITKYIYKNHISLHIHGHLHEEKEDIFKNGTKSICLYKAKIIDINAI